ncbi:nucleotidyltransferase family protein [Anderseniella sp. Alg231-50]|uniref:nucleotidyltransferase family protein n=1 Tax=Anderseniella sp. Alg231-50 TaxID=1922226 RepID=UPI000D555426
MNNTSLLLDNERLDLLIRLLRVNDDIHDTGKLRIELLSDMSSFEAMMQAAARRHLLPAAIFNLRNKGILLPPQTAHVAGSSILAQLADLDDQFNQRRAILASALHEIIACLNNNGIQPLVLKGSISLISGKPEWRFQRDIDFAVEPAAADVAITALQARGFSVCEDMERRPHHLKPMERADVPALIEPHVKLAGIRAREVLPDEVLTGTVNGQSWQGVNYRATSNAGFLLHGLAHHYFQNRGFIYGTFSLKGLLEFAFVIAGLQEADISELNNLTEGHPRLKAALLLWCGVAKHLLGVSPPPGIVLSRAIEKYALIVSDRYQRGLTVSPFTGVREHIAMTLRHAPPTSLVRSTLPPILDGSRGPVWRDHEKQRRNASGLLTDV